jgi:diguanylate cyclase (GGDEF)-like protein
MLYVVYRAPETRLAFPAFFFVALMFGMLRRDSRTVAALGAVSLALFAILAGVRYMTQGDDEVLRLDILQCLVIAVTFPWMVFLGGHVHRIRQGLTDVRLKLEDIEEKARRDDLTGVYNRRALVAAMHDSKQRADATGEPLSICVIDLDLFKRYNDAFDHLTGDRVLRAFAAAVQAGLRNTDVFGRYGGEEFVQILPQTDLAGAMADAQRLRRRISAMELELPITRSVGPLTVFHRGSAVHPSRDDRYGFRACRSSALQGEATRARPRGVLATLRCGLARCSVPARSSWASRWIGRIKLARRNFDYFGAGAVVGAKAGPPARHPVESARRHWRERNVLHALDAVDPMPRLAEAGTRQADLLLVVQRYTLAHRGVDFLGHVVVPNGKQKFFLRSARHGYESQLAFPRFADPALAGELLYPTGAFARRVAPRNHEPDPRRTEHDDDDRDQPECRPEQRARDRISRRAWARSQG